MKQSLSYIADAVGGRMLDETDGSRIISGFFTDSRNAEKGKMFLALRGENSDGNDFVKSVHDNGCCAMVDRENALLSDCVLVSDVRSALQRLACHYRLNEVSRIPVIGITGSVGKTTTKDMTALALSACAKVHKTQGNANSQIGLPITVLGIESDSDVAVVELGMSYVGEMERISRCARPDICMITNIGYSHIENLGTREAILKEKLKIASFSKEGSVLLLDGDEPLMRGVKVQNKKVYFVSESDSSCECYASDIITSGFRVSFTAHIFGREIQVELGVCGRHFVINSLFALAAATLLGYNTDDASKKLAEYQSDGKRQYIYDSDGHTVISDCYNASPESMKAAFSVLAETNCRRRIAVLGDILELGKSSEELHTLVGSYLTGKADVLVTYGTYARLYAVKSGIKEVYSFDEGQSGKLKDFLRGFIREGDAVLYKASNGMRLGEAIV